MRAIRPYPCDRLGWHKYYVKQFNKTQHPDAAYLACLYLNLHFSDGGDIE